MCIFFITTCHWTDNTSWGKVWLFFFFFFWTVKIKVTSYSFQKIIIARSLSFCFGVFYCLQKKILTFSKRVIQVVTLVTPWLLFYSQPHSITVNWFDVSSALSPHNMSVRHHLEEQIANEDNGYAIKTVKYKSYHEK